MQLIAFEPDEIKELISRLERIEEKLGKATPEKPLTAKEAANYLGVSTRTLYEYMNNNDLPFHKVGNFTRFYVSELDEWVRRS